MNRQILKNVALTWVITVMIGTIILSLDWAAGDPFGIGEISKRLSDACSNFLMCLAIALPGFILFLVFLTIPFLAALVSAKAHKCLLAFAIVLFTYVAWRLYAFSGNRPFSFDYVRVYAKQMSFYLVPFVLCIFLLDFSPKQPLKFDFETSS